MCPFLVQAEERCLTTSGEAIIEHHDVASAKLEALARAKWAAIESIAGVQIKASSLIQDMALVDEHIIQKTNGVVRRYKVLHEERQGDLYSVQATVCVSPAAVEQSMGVLTRNTAVGVLIVSRSRHESAVFDSSNIRMSQEYTTLRLDADPFSIAVKQGLLDQKVTVIDLSDKLRGTGESLAQALDRNDATLVQRAMRFSMANALIVGRIDNVISVHKGEDIGYGISMPLHKVASHFQYKILGRNNKGLVYVIHTGTAEGLGMSTSLENANRLAMQDLAEQASHAVINNILTQIDGKARVFDVRIATVPDVDAHALIKDRLQQLQWVQEVEDLGTGHFRVTYLEKPVYLANSIQRINGVRVRDFSSDRIQAVYQLR